MSPLPDREHAVHLLHEMLRIRRFEERCAELYQAEKIRGFLHLYIGEEAVAADRWRPELGFGVRLSLRPSFHHSVKWRNPPDSRP